jgi:predicted DNA-binding transcriptional regulator YafY
MIRSTRAIRILKLLERGASVTRADFLRRLEISPATFKRDLEYLRSELNAPIVWCAAERAYSLRPDVQAGQVRQTIPGTWFDHGELLALIAIQQILDQIEPRLLQDVLHPLRKRTASLLSGAGEQGDQLAAALSRIKVLPMQRRSVDDVVFERVVAALVQRKKLELVSVHRQTQQCTRRIVSPQRIVSYRDNWYLDAWCHLRESLRTFSLDTLTEVHATDQTADEMESDSLDQQLASSYGIFSGRATAEAVMRFSARVAGWIGRERWHPKQMLRHCPNGDIELTVPYAHPTELIRDILKWGPDVEVISPESLRKQVGDAARTTSERYL